jgi:hypothetical protein
MTINSTLFGFLLAGAIKAISAVCAHPASSGSEVPEHFSHNYDARARLLRLLRIGELLKSMLLLLPRLPLRLNTSHTHSHLMPYVRIQ